MDLISSIIFISALLLSQISAEDCQQRDNCECGKLSLHLLRLSSLFWFFFVYFMMIHWPPSNSYLILILIFLVYADGSGYNLKPVIADNSSFVEAITNQNLTFYYHPCGDTTLVPNIPDIKDIDNECSRGYSLCMYNKTENKLVVLGKAGEMNFKLNGDNMQVLFVKTTETGGKVSSVSLECTPKAKTSVLYAPLEKINQVVSKAFIISF